MHHFKWLFLPVLRLPIKTSPLCDPYLWHIIVTLYSMCPLPMDISFKWPFTYMTHTYGHITLSDSLTMWPLPMDKSPLCDSYQWTHHLSYLLPMWPLPMTHHFKWHYVCDHYLWTHRLSDFTLYDPYLGEHHLTLYLHDPYLWTHPLCDPSPMDTSFMWPFTYGHIILSDTTYVTLAYGHII